MRIFVSYSHQNQMQIKLLISDLISMGHEVWYDEHLSGGQAWWNEILEQIHHCDVFLFSLTQEWINSVACQREYEYANALKRALLPVQVEKMNIRLIPKKYQHLQILDYQVPNERVSILKLVQTLNKIKLQPLPVSDDIPFAPEAPMTEFGEIPQKLRNLAHTLEEQVEIFETLRTLVEDKTVQDRAKELMKELREHPDLRSEIAIKIDNILLMVDLYIISIPLKVNHTDGMIEGVVNEFLEFIKNLDETAKRQKRKDLQPRNIDELCEVYNETPNIFWLRPLFENVPFGFADVVANKIKTLGGLAITIKHETSWY